MSCVLTEPFFGSSPTDWSRMKNAHEQLADTYLEGIEAYAKSRGIAPSKRMAEVVGAMGPIAVLLPRGGRLF